MEKSLYLNPIKNKPLVLMMCLLFNLLCHKSAAQLNPFQAMYFQNKYQYNPAMAGMENQLNLNIGYRQQWSSYPGTPKATYFTADFQPITEIGLGLNIADDQEGLIRQTRLLATYAYHLLLNSEDAKLNFGLSLGVNDSRVDLDKITGDTGDAEISEYNQIKPYADADFGIAYTNHNFYLGGGLPYLRSLFFQTSDGRLSTDRLLFIIASNYKIPLDGDDSPYKIEPVVAFRAIKNYKNILDAGCNFGISDSGLYIQGIYHSNQNIGFGVGLEKDAYAFNFTYNIDTSQLSGTTHGAFEFGLKLKLSKN